MRAIAVAERSRAADEEASEQARGPEGRQTLHDRCVEAREAADQLLTAISSQDPGFFELARDELVLWYFIITIPPSSDWTTPAGGYVITLAVIGRWTFSRNVRQMLTRCSLV